MKNNQSIASEEADRRQQTKEEFLHQVPIEILDLAKEYEALQNVVHNAATAQRILKKLSLVSDTGYVSEDYESLVELILSDIERGVGKYFLSRIFS